MIMLMPMVMMLMLMPPRMLPFCLVRVTLALIYLLVSDHVVTLNCFTVRPHFFDFPIVLF